MLFENVEKLSIQKSLGKTFFNILRYLFKTKSLYLAFTRFKFTRFTVLPLGIYFYLISQIYQYQVMWSSYYCEHFFKCVICYTKWICYYFKINKENLFLKKLLHISFYVSYILQIKINCHRTRIIVYLANSFFIKHYEQT